MLILPFLLLLLLLPKGSILEGINIEHFPRKFNLFVFQPSICYLFFVCSGDKGHDWRGAGGYGNKHLIKNGKRTNNADKGSNTKLRMTTIEYLRVKTS